MVKSRFLILTFLVTLFLSLGFAEALRMAVIFPGSIQDGDYNSLGYVAMQEVSKHFGMDVTFSQRVAVPDAQRVMTEYILSGYNIIWAHGGQYVGAVKEVAPKYPDVTFIIEDEAPPDPPLDNVITIGREYHLGFYVLGALAAMVSETKNVGYIGGLQLPFTVGEINAVYQAIQDTDPSVKLHYLYTGDFNDVLKARQGAEALIAKGCDVIISALNLGNYGLFEAVKRAERKVYFTATYTSKYQYAPENFLAADLFNFTPTLIQIIEGIKAGKRSGYVSMEWGEGKARYTELPVHNVSPEVNEKIAKIAKAIETGEIQVIKNLREIVFEK